MRKLILIFLVILLNSFTNINISGPISNSLPKEISVKTYENLQEIIKIKKPAEQYLTNFNIITDNLPINLPIDSIGYTGISSSYGYRESHPIFKTKKMHNGIDFSGKIGTSIFPSAKGVIKKIGYSFSYGNYIIIEHHPRLTTMYAHLKTINCFVGANVDEFTIIGKLGNTGWSTGPHLHYEVRVDNIPVNPIKFLTENKKVFYNRNVISNIFKSNKKHCYEYKKGTTGFFNGKFNFPKNS